MHENAKSVRLEKLDPPHQTNLAAEQDQEPLDLLDDEHFSSCGYSDENDDNGDAVLLVSALDNVGPTMDRIRIRKRVRKTDRFPDRGFAHNGQDPGPENGPAYGPGLRPQLAAFQCILNKKKQALNDDLIAAVQAKPCIYVHLSR
uniref:Uncharacterized protein n=1 Tax=Ditylenchus dipsaci TaxID=166011 RepID=A0A915DIF9_9BILA